MPKTLKEYENYVVQFIKRLRDVRFAGLVLFVVIVLLISWSGVKAIQTNYGLEKQISKLRQQNNVQKLADDNLALENNYYNTSTYLDLSARQNLGLAAPGEQELIVPQSVAMSYTVDVPTPKQTEQPQDKQPAYQRNFQSWVNFFLHRQQTDGS